MSKQKHYLIYQITNLVNGKIYIGKHETYNLEDRYFGSGKCLAKAKEKYGLENFEFKILIDLKNKEEMNLLEKMVVSEEFCKRKDTYNINVGGEGGWTYVNDELHCNGNQQWCKNFDKAKINARQEKAVKTQKQNRENYTPEERQAYLQMKHDIALMGFSQSFKGKHHTEETRRKIGKITAVSQRGKGNSQYGKRWIHSDVLKLSFPVSEAQFWDYIGEGWIVGRVRNWKHHEWRLSLEQKI